MSLFLHNRTSRTFHPHNNNNNFLNKYKTFWQKLNPNLPWSLNLSCRCKKESHEAKRKYQNWIWLFSRDYRKGESSRKKSWTWMNFKKPNSGPQSEETELSSLVKAKGKILKKSILMAKNFNTERIRKFYKVYKLSDQEGKILIIDAMPWYFPYFYFSIDLTI